MTEENEIPEVIAESEVEINESEINEAETTAAPPDLTLTEAEFATLEDEKLPTGHRAGFVAVIGRPNVGKSSLMNQLLKQKVAIVSPRPQTTRTRQLGIITESEYQIVFVDTPGMMKPRHKLDEFMLQAAVDALKDADIILWLLDGTELPTAEDYAIGNQITELELGEKTIVAINKVDLIAPDHLIPTSNTFRELLPTAEWVLFSALKGNGCDALLKMLVAALPEGPRYYPTDQITDSYMREIAGEMVREAILLELKDEIPHGTAVVVEEYKEKENGVVYISATIFVERDGHKKILIGAKGMQLRQIGSLARREIEELVGTRVFLELWVKVEPKWRRNENSLKRFGYFRPNES